MRWKFHPDASEEYLASCRYYADIGGKLGEAFTHSVEAAIAQIVAQPTAWREIEEDVRRHLLTRFPFGIYYTIETDYVLIVAVMHMNRRPGYWRGRLP
ncbi:MAG: plasmid stabilization protein [Lentisphaerae bacterium RIFOXYA12_64_32]|nr:MAG: plasmid stabilization protein [Lentisphaerae bacterium RIFOXYA12_64_32]